MSNIKYRTVRFPSKFPYIGNVGTKSVQGYWTIWEVRIKFYDYRWVVVSSPKPVHINFGEQDFKKYRGKLYDVNSLGRGILIESQVSYCDNCNKSYSYPLDDKICAYCGAEL